MYIYVFFTHLKNTFEPDYTMENNVINFLSEDFYNLVALGTFFKT